MTTMEDVQERMAHSRLMADLSVLRASKVIGMTTTCAAKYQALLREVQPRIVIVEEAAEVLEAHVVTSLAPQTQHVILIGDHQQLRPPTNVQELSIRYKMDVSLFERMLINGVGVKQLCVQHRMRPDFARLLTPRFYPTLEPHPCVERYEDIEGMTTNMFFFNHSSPERKNSGRSYSNVFEANFLVNLCRYLLAQGYQPSQITLLTPYMGQKKLLERTANTYHELTAVAITVVDNFQGEENDIILLSLVRSNETGETGFVQVANRICVLLSRARMGFYCVGNMTLLSEASNLWRDIVDDLKYRGLVGCELKLRCRRHSNSTAVVRTPEDFPSGRNGFCNLPCPASLPCGHSCPKNCHMDTEDHKLFTCRERCGKTCSRGHCCNERCHGHCTRCTVHIKVEFPACHHTSKVPCYMADEATCTKKCGRRLKSCGHPCGKKCGELCGGACMVSNVENSVKPAARDCYNADISVQGVVLSYTAVILARMPVVNLAQNLVPGLLPAVIRVRSPATKRRAHTRASYRAQCPALTARARLYVAIHVHLAENPARGRVRTIVVVPCVANLVRGLPATIAARDCCPVAMLVSEPAASPVRRYAVFASRKSTRKQRERP
ncbi:NFX1-type zinc finger-containing protein 1-like [Ornithodoros turicata]|uniref:NFX1-type zinc finger-containing protein 1-like n=1 Tax=Ornithodoros turicata TaxID=34597 RepID=UPI003139B220